MLTLGRIERSRYLFSFIRSHMSCDDRVGEIDARLGRGEAFQADPVLHGHDRIDDQLALVAGAVVDDPLGLAAVEIEAAGDEQQQAGAEQQPALAARGWFRREPV